MKSYKRALEIRDKLFDPEHPDIAHSLNNIGIIESNQGNNDKALEYYQKALQIRKKSTMKSIMILQIHTIILQMNCPLKGVVKKL